MHTITVDYVYRNQSTRTVDEPINDLAIELETARAAGHHVTVRVDIDHPDHAWSSE